MRVHTATRMLAHKCTCYDKSGRPINKSTKCCKMSRTKTTVIGCEVTARHFERALLRNKPVTVMCTSSCAHLAETTPGWEVYGSSPFRDDSSICKAAFEAGVIGDKGGVATLLFAGRVWRHGDPVCLECYMPLCCWKSHPVTVWTPLC